MTEPIDTREKTESDEPNLAKFLMLNEEPKKVLSSTLKVEPHLVSP
jgi:hypothetical protein